jgi:hypothetical protein
MITQPLSDFDSAPGQQLVMDRVVPPNDDTLSTITRLGRKLVELLDTKAQQTAQLETIDDAIRDIAEKRLPDLLEAVGLTELQLTSGQKIQTKVDYYASIPKGTASAAFLWLRSKNMGAIIKEVVTVSPNQKEYLTSVSVPFEVVESVHPSTLKALVKEQIEAGNEFPRELFGVHVANKVVVK